MATNTITTHHLAQATSALSIASLGISTIEPAEMSDAEILARCDAACDLIAAVAETLAGFAR